MLKKPPDHCVHGDGDKRGMLPPPMYERYKRKFSTIVGYAESPMTLYNRVDAVKTAIPKGFKNGRL